MDKGIEAAALALAHKPAWSVSDEVLLRAIYTKDARAAVVAFLRAWEPSGPETRFKSGRGKFHECALAIKKTARAEADRLEADRG